MPTGDIYRVTLEGAMDSEPFVLGLGFVSQSGAADFAVDAAQLMDEVDAALDLPAGSGGAFLGPLSFQFKINFLRVQDLSPGVAAGLVRTEGVAGGNLTEDAMPPNDALCVTWRTGLKGKSYRGRSYLGGFAEDSQNGGYWIGEIQTWAAAAFAQPLMDAFGPVGTGNYSLSVVHTVLGGARLIPPTATPIISFNIHNEVRSLRRRAVGVRISRHRSTP
jgi:hypothetical protein